jgi:hypothetical protein
MGKIVSSLIAAAALLLAFNTTAKAEESNRGFYEGNLGNGGRVVFFASGNKVISVFVLDTSGQKTYFGSGSLNGDGTFTLTLTGGVTITGTLSANGVTASFQSQNISANRVQSFGSFASIAGRFNGLAHSKARQLNDVRFMIDSDGRIFFVGRDGDQALGGSGNVNVGERKRHHDDDGARDGDDDDDRDRDGDDDDEDRDEHQDDGTRFFSGTFTITLTNGQTITGTVDFSRGRLVVRFTFNGEEFEFDGDREATFNHLANISTRGFVNTGQGQLIGGFIITGGPKMVIVRASGPSLAAQGVSPVLANPRLQLFQNDHLIRENDDWNSNSNANDITKSGVAPTDSKEAALLIRLEPGFYTTVVSGVDNGTGIALVDIYELDRD